MCRREGVSLHRGMNFGLGGNHSVILMSVRPNAPYRDRLEDGVARRTGPEERGHSGPEERGHSEFPNKLTVSEQPNGIRNQFVARLTRTSSTSSPTVSDLIDPPLTLK